MKQRNDPVQLPKLRYASKEIGDAIEKIREIRKLDIDAVKKCHIERVLELMKLYHHNIRVQQSACQTLANICMHESVRLEAITMESHLKVLECLKHYAHDWKLGWLACSALWNMTLSPEARHNFPLDSVGVLLNVLQQHNRQERLVKVIMGCLSNLSLTGIFRMYIGNEENVDYIIMMMHQHMKEIQISATAAGLMANLAVSDELANMIVNKGIISLLKMMLSHKYYDPTFCRNIVAELRNCRTGYNFIQECVKYQIVEELFDLLDSDVIEEYIDLPITMICNTLNASISHRPSSFHLCCLHGFLETFVELMVAEEQCGDVLDFDLTDKFNHTLLSYAIEGHAINGCNGEMVKFLIMGGASTYTQEQIKIPTDLVEIITDSNEIMILQRKMYRQEFLAVAEECYYRVPESIGEMIISYVPSYTLLTHTLPE